MSRYRASCIETVIAIAKKIKAGLHKDGMVHRVSRLPREVVEEISELVTVALGF